MKSEDDRLLCQTGAGTPMGEVMRRYWQPILLSSDLPHPECPPKRFKLLGENLVAFRNSDGKIGVLDEFCCHRGASLAIGRVEDCGLRCLFHGWKFALDGTILDMPNVEDPRTKERMKAKAYPAREAGDMIWVYMGPPEKEPPFRHLEYMDVPSPQRLVVRMDLACNYLHVLEATLDSAHVGILHVDRERNQARADNVDKSLHLVQSFGLTQIPKIEVRETEFGLDYAAIRSPGDGADDVVVRVTPFIMPNLFMIPPGTFLVFVVPYDDENIGWFVSYWSRENPIEREPLLKRMGLRVPGAWINDKMMHSWDNNFFQDREAMAKGSWSGMAGLTVEDVAVALSMAPKPDRAKENLVPTDAALVRARRLLLGSIDRVQRGEDPIGLAPSNSLGIQAAEKKIRRGEPWHSIVPGHLPEHARRPELEPTV